MTRRTSLFILSTIWFLCSSSTVRAQISTLPPCAIVCATTAAAANDCALTDLRCLCSKRSFISATLECDQLACPVEDRSTAAGLLGEMCAGVPPATSTPSTSASSSLPTSRSTRVNPPPGTMPISTTPSAPPRPPISTGTTSTSPSVVTVTTTPPAGGVTPTGLTITDTSFSSRSSDASTTVVVATVFNPPSSSSSAIRNGHATAMYTLIMAMAFGLGISGWYLI